MTLLAYEAQESWLPVITGMTCSAILVEEDSLLLHFGPAPDSDIRRTIVLHGTWRAERGNAVIAGSGDIDPDAIPDDLQQLVGNTLERTAVDHPGFELALYFSNGCTLRSFPCDSNQFAAELADDEDDEYLPVSWWVEGDDIPVDWEAFHDA